jgi:hypothetical protein
MEVVRPVGDASENRPRRLTVRFPVLIFDPRAVGFARDPDGKAAGLRTGADLVERTEQQVVDEPRRVRTVVELARDTHRRETSAKLAGGVGSAST